MCGYLNLNEANLQGPSDVIAVHVFALDLTTSIGETILVETYIVTWLITS